MPALCGAVVPYFVGDAWRTVSRKQAATAVNAGAVMPVTEAAIIRAMIGRAAEVTAGAKKNQTIEQLVIDAVLLND
jgi:hypothetical protein